MYFILPDRESLSGSHGRGAITYAEVLTMSKSLCLAVLVFASGIAAAELSEKFSKRLESADAAYQAAIQKADNLRFYAVQKATQERVKVLKTALTDATKGGDFDAATEIKARLAAAETAGGVRPKPKNTVKFGGHEYAVIEEKVTWHLAKRICEEMGGHLAIIETPMESEALLTLCRQAKQSVWIGATDEAKEGDWKWLNGMPVKIEFRNNNNLDLEHYLSFYMDANGWDDLANSRIAFLCEWDS